MLSNNSRRNAAPFRLAAFSNAQPLLLAKVLISCFIFIVIELTLSQSAGPASWITLPLTSAIYLKAIVNLIDK